MRIVCQQTILMEYHALFVSKILNCLLLQITGGALRVKVDIRIFYVSIKASPRLIL